jgi:hypothetical protein
VGVRLYLVALGGDDERRWVVLDGDGQAVARRADVRDAASIVAMCELAADFAGGGDLERLRAELDLAPAASVEADPTGQAPPP